MEDKKTIHIRINRDLHKQLKFQSIKVDKTITKLASQMILHCLANNINFFDEVDTIEIY
jgi:hypothetical protein